MKRTLIIDNRARLAVAGLSESALEDIRCSFTHKNPDHGAKQAMGFPTWKTPRHILTVEETDDEISAPRGGTSRMREILRRRNIDFRVIDRRCEGAPVVSFPEYIGKPLWNHQVEAMEAAIRREQCIIRMPTGSGKSLMSYALIARIKLSAIVILPTQGLFDQWYKGAIEAFGGKRQIGRIQGKRRELRPITIAMQKTLARNPLRDEDLTHFGAVVIDEAQLAAADTYTEVIDRFPARYRIAISADERRKDRKEFVTYDLCGESAYEISRSDIEDKGHIVDVLIDCVPTDFRADWYGLPDEDDIEKHVDWTRLLDEMTANKARNDLIKRFMNESISSGEQAIMLTARREHAKAFDTYFASQRVRSGLLLGAQDGGDRKEFERTIEGLKSGDVKVGVGTYNAFGYGIDMPAVSFGAAVTPIAGNNQVFNQVRGRLCRSSPGKKNGRLVYPWDEAVYPEHLAKIRSKNRNVRVWHRGQWVDARSYIREKREREA